MHLFLSPHFDDAVYSCGGTIHRLVKAQERVTVLTLMAGEPPKPLPDTPLVRTLHKRWKTSDEVVKIRHKEDTKAMKVLGAQGLYWDIQDCIYRTINGIALYPTENDLWDEIHPDDYAPTMLQHIATLTTELIGEMVSVVYAPLGVGRHVDHRIVRDWARALARLRPEWTLKFYTDYPYMRDQQRVEQALAESGMKLIPEDIYLSSRNMNAKIKAMTYYKTQVSTFWKDEDTMATEVKALFAHNKKGFAERYWIRKDNEQ